MWYVFKNIGNEWIILDKGGVGLGRLQKMQGCEVQVQGKFIRSQCIGKRYGEGEFISLEEREGWDILFCFNFLSIGIVCVIMFDGEQVLLGGGEEGWYGVIFGVNMIIRVEYF